MTLLTEPQRFHSSHLVDDYCTGDDDSAPGEQLQLPHAHRRHGARQRHVGAEGGYGLPVEGGELQDRGEGIAAHRRGIGRGGGSDGRTLTLKKNNFV